MEGKFNIFGSTLVRPLQNKHLGVSLNENATVGKGSPALKPFSPSRMKNQSAPVNSDPKRRTFMQNEGASIQGLYSSEMRKIQTSKPPLIVYEDNYTSLNDSIELESNNKPVNFEDTSDDEFVFTNQELDNIVFGLTTPKFDVNSMKKPEMIAADDYFMNSSVESIPDIDINDDEFSID